MKPSTFKVSRLIWLALGTIIIGLVLYQLRNALLPFIVGGALAYILEPFISWLERRTPWMSSRPELKRVIHILVIYSIFVVLVIAALLAFIPPITTEIRSFVENVPTLIERSRGTIESLDAQITERLPEEIVAAIHDAAQDLGKIIVSALLIFAARTYGVISQTLSLLLGLAMVPLILFYLLKDGDKIIGGMLSILSPEPRKHTRNVLDILNGVFSSYIRGQLILGLVVGVLVFVGLMLLRVPFAPVLGLVAGITELIPIIGPWLGAIPGLLVVLATAPEKLIWVGLLYLGVQLVENSLLVPRIQGDSLDMHPVMVLAALIVGSEVAGFWGVILGPPLAAAGREVLVYFLGVWRSQDMDEAPAIDMQEDAEIAQNLQDSTSAVESPSDD